MKIKKLLPFNSYLTEKNRCFIPRCKAKCCANAPLPEGFAEKMQGCASRDVYYSINIGRNDPRDPFNSVIYNTRELPLVPIGHDTKSGAMLYHYNAKFAKELGIKTQDEAVQKLKGLEAQGYYNYCPFLNNSGRCQVYAGRPPICREFGSSPTPINYCPDKSSKYDIFKFYAKDIFLFYKNQVISIFRKIKKLDKADA